MTGALLAAVVVAADTEVVVHATKEVAESSASVTSPNCSQQRGQPCWL